MNSVRIVNTVNQTVLPMASPLERREREKAELRTKILDAARELFVREGYEAVTMRKIADKIEYSPTAIYLHFADKDTLIRELCDHDFQAFAAGFLDVAAIADPVERLRKAGHVYAAFGLQHPQQYRLMFMALRPFVEPTKEETADPTRNAYVFLRETVEQAIVEGRLRREFEDAELLAQTIWAGVHGVVALEIAQGCEKGWVNWRPVQKRVEAMIDMILSAILADERAPSSSARKGPAPREKSASGGPRHKASASKGRK
jgi:AcrR family transcriptional regulator